MKYVNNQSGTTQIIVALALTAILGAAALVVDVGVAMAERINLSNGLDAASLAGGQELPANPDKAVTVAQQYLAANGIDPGTTSINISHNNTQMTITGSKIVLNRFARVLGVNTTTVNAEAGVMVGPVTAVQGGLRPLAVVDQPLIYGQSVTLKEGAGDAVSGNYNAVSFGSEYGASVFLRNLLYGYPGVIRVGETIETEPGNMASYVNDLQDYLAMDTATFDDYDRSSPRVWTLPVVDNWDVNGRDDVEVVGFAAFFVEDISQTAGHAEVIGRFIKFTTNGEIGQSMTDYGVYGIKMILPSES